MARVEAEAGQLGEELPRRGASFTLSASLGDSGSVSVPSEATLQRKGLPGLAVWWVWSLSLFSSTVSGLVRRFI